MPKLMDEISKRERKRSEARIQRARAFATKFYEEELPCRFRKNRQYVDPGFYNFMKDGYKPEHDADLRLFLDSGEWYPMRQPGWFKSSITGAIVCRFGRNSCLFPAGV